VVGLADKLFGGHARLWLASMPLHLE